MKKDNLLKGCEPYPDWIFPLLYPFLFYLFPPPFYPEAPILFLSLFLIRSKSGESPRLPLFISTFFLLGFFIAGSRNGIILLLLGGSILKTPKQILYSSLLGTLLLPPLYQGFNLPPSLVFFLLPLISLFTPFHQKSHHAEC